MRARAVTSEQIIAAADRVARKWGLDELTVRALCAELGVTAPAICRHFDTKDAIVELLIDDIIGRISLPAPESGDWVTRLRDCFLSAHDEVAPYKGLAARMGHQMPATGSAKRNSDYLNDLLHGVGIGEKDTDLIVQTVFVYVWGYLLTDKEARAPKGKPLSDRASREQFLWGLNHLLDSFRREFDPRRAAATALRRAGAG